MTDTKRETRAHLSNLRLGQAQLARQQRMLTRDEAALRRALAENEDLLLRRAARRWWDWNPDNDPRSYSDY